MPSINLERDILRETGVSLIAGVDEAGRGAIAGPVVAAAVILPLDKPEELEALDGVDDSKQLNSKVRAELFELVLEYCVAYGIGSATAAEIDQYGIIPANVRAMSDAVGQLDPAPGYLLIDGRMRLTRVPVAQRSVVRGDTLSLSIAAASILAKVSRDRLMQDLDKMYPQYSFTRHKGYCTIDHVAALERYGACVEHRHTFAPIRPTLL